MKPVIISFSETLNNEQVARKVSKALHLDWIKLQETKKRTMMTNFIDILCHRKPKIALDLALLKPYEMIIFMGPVWLGHPASPFRRIFKYLKEHPKSYGLISVCGGNCDVVSNPKLPDILEKRTGMKPKFVKELKLFDLMPDIPEKEKNERMFKYQMNEKETALYADQAQALIEQYL